MPPEIATIPTQNILSTEEKIRAILEKVRPYIQMHGGDVWLVSINEQVVTLRVEGACVGCPLAQLTYNGVIKKLIKEDAPEILDVLLA